VLQQLRAVVEDSATAAGQSEVAARDLRGVAANLQSDMDRFRS